MSKNSSKQRLRQLRNWIDNSLNFNKGKKNVQGKNGRQRRRNGTDVETRNETRSRKAT